MARLTRSGRVDSGQREFGCAVVKGRGLPRRGRMARLTILTEIARNVVWIRCTGKVRTVTLIAV